MFNDLLQKVFCIKSVPTPTGETVVLQRYQVTWNMHFDTRCDVSLMLDPGMVALAIKGGGVKETPSRLELCKLVRDMAIITHPQLRMEPIWFESLTIQPLSSSPRPD